MFEKNRQKIAQTQEIIQHIDTQLNDYLAQRGLLQSSGDRFTSIEKQIYIAEQKNQSLRSYNLSLQQQNHQIDNEMMQLKQDFQERLYMKLQQQQNELQQKFEQQVNQFGEKARNRLMSTLQQEDQYSQQYNNLQQEKQNLIKQLSQLRNQNHVINQERNELEGSYQSLLQMHNQLLQVDLTQNELNSGNKSNVINILNNYKLELEQLRGANERIQQQMNSELQGLRLELQRQKTDNQILVQKVQHQNPEINEGLYEQIFNNPKLQNITPQKPKKRKKSEKRRKRNISQTKLTYFQQELKRLQDIVQAKIQTKRSQQ
ncbi:hypothetical protein pb186bvf_005264 [Paramecium bursaria]